LLKDREKSSNLERKPKREKEREEKKRKKP